MCNCDEVLTKNGLSLAELEALAWVQGQFELAKMMARTSETPGPKTNREVTSS